MITVLPTKNVSVSEALFGLGAIIISLVSKNHDLNVDDCYHLYIEQFYETKKIKYKSDFNQFFLAILYLYTIKLINIEESRLVINYENY